MKTLEKFVEQDLKIDKSNEKYQKLLSCGRLNGFQEALRTSFVISNQHCIALPRISSRDNHKSVVDKCIIHLLNKKLYNHVLTYGYKIARCEDVDSILHCASVNTNVSLIKGSVWQLIHDVIGTNNFIHLLINCTILKYNGVYFTQIVGNRVNEPNVPPKWCHKKVLSESGLNYLHSPINNKSFLYKSSRDFRFFSIISPKNNAECLRKIIFNPDLIKMQTPSKKRIDSMLYQLIKNNRNKVKYLRILNNLCPNMGLSMAVSHLDRKTPVDQVIRFLIVILEKLIPREMFGSKKNKSKIFAKISVLLKLPIKGMLPFEEVMTSLKLKDFTWLQSSEKHFSRHDFEYKTLLMQHFIWWLFSSLIPRIISAFFYCTEVSSCVEIIYFRHDVWNTMSVPFLENYFEKHLVENPICRNHESYTLSNFNHNNLRLIPKKAKGEFRVIAVPRKGADKEEFATFKDNVRSVIYPAQCVLEYLRNKRITHFKKLHSANQIAPHIRNFKVELLAKYSQLPELHFMKFDIASCYDSIPRKKAMDVIHRALKNESGFFVRSQSYFNPNKGTLQIQNVVNGSRKPRDDEVYIDNVRTVYLTNEDLIRILEMELFKTALSFNGTCYLRKDGLYQGSNLSALVVDLVYDDFLEHYEVFHPTNHGDTLVLRLADDFLIISTDKSQIFQIKNTTLNGFEEYNAQVNVEKIRCASSQSDENDVIQFCALHLSTGELEVYKHMESLNVPSIRLLSTTSIYGRIMGLFEMRLSYGTTDSKLNSRSAILNQIHHISTNIAQTFSRSFKGKIITLECFQAFFECIVLSAITSCMNSTWDADFLMQLRLTVANCFLQALLPRQASHKSTVKYLRDQFSK